MRLDFGGFGTDYEKGEKTGGKDEAAHGHQEAGDVGRQSAIPVEAFSLKPPDGHIQRAQNGNQPSNRRNRFCNEDNKVQWPN